jgi:hypothetical protein
MSKRISYGLMATCFILGFFVCYIVLTHAPSEKFIHSNSKSSPPVAIFQQTGSEATKKPQYQIDRPDNSTLGKLSSVAPGLQIFRVPSNITNTVIPSLLARNDTEISSISILPYGLPREEVPKLANFLNSKASQIAELEAENSQLVTDSSGNQFIKITPFPEAGTKIKAEIEAEISKYFKNFDDDRASIFKQQLFKSILYDDFGENLREISIDDSVAPNGEAGHVFSISRYNNGRLVSRRSDPLSLPLMEGRFGNILRKHQDQIAP